MRCPSAAERRRRVEELKAFVYQSSCETSLSKLKMKKLDCGDLQSIRDFKSAVLGRFWRDEETAEALASYVCPLTSRRACMNPEPQCRQVNERARISTANGKPWTRDSLEFLKAYFHKDLPVDDAQAETLARGYMADHPSPVPNEYNSRSP